MNWVNTAGVIGSFLFLIKIAIHIYIKRQIKEKFYVGASGDFLNPILFLPVFDDAIGYLKVVKIVCNLIYLVSIILITIFLIGTNMH